ncbi:MAG TPA: DUF998 domain-containing protein [Thermohalobaculum sp.]|nr:DUF998 domain-containing protein [Thermohalobaculum sp.]
MAATTGSRSGEAMRVAGALALLGCVAVVVANIVGSIVVDRHDWVRDTVSYLAQGRNGWIQDTGLLLFALGIAALAVGLWLLDLGGLAWKIGALCLLLMACDVVLISLYEQYGERTPEGVVVHSQAVWALGGLFPLALLLLSGGLARVGPGWRRFTLAAAILWIVLAPPFFLMPTGFDGLYERVLVLIVIAWIVPVSVMLIAEGRAR